MLKIRPENTFMFKPFDIFAMKETSNEWLGSAPNVTEAVARICDTGPGLYAMFCQEDKTVRSYLVDANGIISDITTS
jgi:hypothetical protein